MVFGGAGRRPAPVPSGIVTKGRDASGGSVSVANRARRREAADGKKLEGERGHWLKCVAENLRKFGIIARRTTTFRRARAARRVISIKV